MSIVPVPESIESFRDALGLALELSDEFAYAHAVVVLSPERRSVDFRIFTAVVDNPSAALGWLSCRFPQNGNAASVLLISVRSVDGWSIYEQDLTNYRFARTTIERLGGFLLDWIETDGELVRSYSHLVSPNTAWSLQAVAEGVLGRLDW